MEIYLIGKLKYRIINYTNSIPKKNVQIKLIYTSFFNISSEAVVSILEITVNASKICYFINSQQLWNPVDSS